MELRIHTEETIQAFEISNAMLDNMIAELINLAISEVDKIPLATTSIKTVLRMGMSFNGIINPDPKHQSDITFVSTILRDKVIGYLAEKGLDAQGVSMSESRN